MSDQQQPNESVFQPFAKIPRLSRDIVVTEKIDGTNAQILLLTDEERHRERVLHNGITWTGCELRPLTAPVTSGDGLHLFAGSRTRWIRPKLAGERGDPDNYGFAAWCQHNAEDLFKLGPGRHYGEWFGSGINRGYGLAERQFALFNVSRWIDIRQHPLGTRFENDKQDLCPACCTVVPVLYRGSFCTSTIQSVMNQLVREGSRMVSGFMRPEGIIIFHTAGGVLFKKTIEGDESPKGVPGLTDSKALAAGVEAANRVFNDKLADYTQNQ